MSVFRLFGRKPRSVDPYRAWIEELLAEQRAAGQRWYDYEPKDSTAGRRLLAASPEEQRGFVLAAADWLDHRDQKQPPPP